MPNPAARFRTRGLLPRMFPWMCSGSATTVEKLVGAAMVLSCIAMTVGCHSEPEIRVYTIPTDVPSELLPEKQRMLAAMVPVDDQVWFFKILGPQSPVTSVENEFRVFVRTMTYAAGVPDLASLPDGWKRGGEKPFRYASVDINTDDKQLDLSISKLSAGDDWDSYVASNVNRWRGQVGLESSQQKWAGAEAFDVEAVDQTGIWVDLIGEPGAGSTAMTPPFAGMASQPPASDDPHANLPPETRERIASGNPVQARAKPLDEMSSAKSGEPRDGETKGGLQYDRPDGWRDGRMSMMRLAAFEAGDPDQSAEITVISAGGDLRSNVKRWLGQVMGTTPSDEQVDEALEQGEAVKVGSLDGQRFLLAGDDEKGTAFDAVVVPLENDFSMFIKMTGPKPTVLQQREAMSSFLDSLSFEL